MIHSFRCAETERIWQGQVSRVFPARIQRAALRKLIMLDAATNVIDLRIPSGNRLEKLHGNREGQWSIRVNDQYRICFEWIDGNAYLVEMVDYH